ncbi:hypothetical protein AAG570_009272 [Ranatra chinensis]|uniref:Condensin complex subunit 1 C-terminal domain-containing protein n=1 Tax=Ranatra chinensis TaxID=642074 RepID=A0ABD0ZAC4_9HEMI
MQQGHKVKVLGLERFIAPGQIRSITEYNSYRAIHQLPILWPLAPFSLVRFLVDLLSVESSDVSALYKMERIFMRKPDLGVLEVFDVAQRSKNAHGRLVNRLFSIYQKSNQRHFTVEYLQCLCLCFCNEKQVGVENSLSFAAKYFAFHSQNIDPSSQDTFILTVYKFLFRHHSGEQMKRVRVCEFINRLLVSMSDDAEIDENVFQLLSNAMLERLQDKVASVRTQAVNALHRLQEPYNADCSIIKAMKYHLEHDPSPEVRTKVLSLIAVTQSTLSTILTRKDDKIATVRKEFYKVVSKIKLVRFTLKQRQEIVRSGFRDRSVGKNVLARIGLKESEFLTKGQIDDV